MKRLKVDLPPFDYSVFVALGTREEAEKLCCQIFGEHNDFAPTWEGACCYAPGFYPLIWIKGFPKTHQEHAVLAHEATHAALHVMDWVGIKANGDNSETLAHLVGYIVKEILHGVAPKKKGKKGAKGGTK